MVSAVVLLNVERNQINEVAERLAAIEGVSEVHSVAGRYDLVAILRVRTNEELADLVTAQMLKLESIQSTETLIAFRAYSRHDLEAAFSLGPTEA
jgi:DNA-binding Lrp family transcriptional regulator